MQVILLLHINFDEDQEHPHYSKLKMCFLALQYNLSDTQTEESIYDRALFQYFVDINIFDKNIHDATTLCDFRLHLNTHTIFEHRYLK